MENLVKQLNSSEDIDVAEGKFYVELNFFKQIRTRGDQPR